MTSREERLAEHVDRVLKELERESIREVAVKEDDFTTRLELRSVSWTRWIAAGPFLFFALSIVVPATISLFEGGVRNTGPSAMPAFIIAASFAVIGLIVVSVREVIVISQRDLCISSGIRRLRVTRRVALSAIREVRVGAFTFASWDPYVVVVTEHRRYRFAWGVSQAGAREIAETIRRALPPAV